MRKLLGPLWVRLSLTFTVTVLIVFLFVGVAGQTIIRGRGAPLPFEDRPYRPEGPATLLSDYYRQHQSWDGVGELFETPALSPFANLLFVADAAGRIVYGRSDEERIDPEQPQQAIPVWVDGEIVGYVGATRPAIDASLLQERVLLDISRDLLIVALVGGVLGVVFGTIISRTLTAPLNRLAEAAQAIGAGKLNRRVAAKGSREIVAVAQAFNEMAASLEEQEKLRRNLVADVAHELRTPLSVLQGNLQAILDDVYALDKAEIARLYDQTRVLSRLVEDLHELSQADAGQLPLDLQPFDLARLLEVQVDAFRPIADGKGVTLNTQVSVKLPPVLLDIPRMSQVFHNLLGNALRHTPEGGSITVSIRQEEAHLRVDVHDTGEGIPPEHLPYVFERFYRVNNARSRDTGGAGLGLAIARAIVEAHGGTISASSEGLPGRGSTFTICLPVHQGEPPEPSPGE